MTKNINFTKSAIDQLITIVPGKRTYFKDEQIRGLSLAVQPNGKKSFYVVKKIAGQSAKIFLGKYPDLTIDQARRLAKITLGKIALGENPQTEKQRIRQEMTFGELFELYMSRYSKLHKITWLSDQQEIERFCGHLFGRKLSKITRLELIKLHETINVDNGPYMANVIIKKLRAIYNKADEWGWQGINPAKGIKKFKEHSRDRFLQPLELPYVISAILADTCATTRDFFRLLLMTGVRKSSAKKMRWEHISWDFAEWRIPVTKNGEALIVPLIEPAIAMLQERRLTVKSDWVFPRKTDDTKPISDVTPQWQRIRKQANDLLQASNPLYGSSLLDVRIHDLRRTFGSYQAIAGGSLAIIGKSLGHKSMQSTQIYARLNIDAVRASVIKGTNAILNIPA